MTATELCNKALEATGTNSASSVTGTPKPYTPAVGDVVEFDRGTGVRMGVAYMDSVGDLCVLDNKRYINIVQLIGPDCKKIGTSDINGTPSDADVARILKDFAQPTFTGSYEVGDTVKVINDDDGGYEVGTIGIVTDASSQRSLGIRHKGLARWHNAKNLEPVK